MPDFLLITGIPGTGKTTFGDNLANGFGFTHYDLERQVAPGQSAINPAQLIADILRSGDSAVVTWGFLPEWSQVDIVLRFKAAGFKLVWFDGNRPAALRRFIERGTVEEVFFYAQMQRIELSGVISAIQPVIIDPFDGNGEFKPTAELLKEIGQ